MFGNKEIQKRAPSETALSIATTFFLVTFRKVSNSASAAMMQLVMGQPRPLRSKRPNITVVAALRENLEIRRKGGQRGIIAFGARRLTTLRRRRHAGCEVRWSLLARSERPRIF